MMITSNNVHYVNHRVTPVLLVSPQYHSEVWHSGGYPSGLWTRQLVSPCSESVLPEALETDPEALSIPVKYFPPGGVSPLPASPFSIYSAHSIKRSNAGFGVFFGYNKIPLGIISHDEGYGTGEYELR